MFKLFANSSKKVINKYSINLWYNPEQAAQTSPGNISKLLTIWLVAILTITLAIFGYKAYVVKQIREENQKIIKLQTQLSNQKEKFLLYVNVLLRKEYIKSITQDRYDPQAIIIFIDSILTPQAKVNSYLLDSEGKIQLSATANNLTDASLVWFYLLSHKDTIRDLNLTNFSATEESNSVNFSLSGSLNLLEVYKKYALQ